MGTNGQQESPQVGSTANGPNPRHIGVLTAGGDAPGMNAAIRSVVRCASTAGMSVTGFRRGYDGLIRDVTEPLAGRAVANIIQRGGTFLETSRSDEFRTVAGRGLAVRNLKRREIGALVVIGGEGSMRGASLLALETDVPVYVIPASIDNDIPATEYAIGFDTAVNTALEAIDRIRDTAFAYERVFCVEVMGRDSGFIALAVAIGAGAEAVIVPEFPPAIEEICNRVEESHRGGKRSSIIIVSEGPRTGGVIPVAEALTKRLGAQARMVVLGHVQRGGAPTARDRLLASRMGAEAVQAILDHEPSSLIGEERGAMIRVPLQEAIERRRPLDPALVALVHRLST
jgi:6-phosphofructokinase 1